MTLPHSVDVSVIVVTWNTRDLVLKCLTSLSRAGPQAVEIIVVDNGSSDGTADAVERMFPQVRTLRNMSNQGFAAAVNLGIAQARGRIFFLLNPDTEVENGVFDALLAFFDDHPKAGIAGPPVIGPGGEFERSTRRFPSAISEITRMAMLHRLLPGPERRWNACGIPVRVDAVTGAAMAVRRQCVAQTGGMDPGFFLYYEDTDWCFRAAKAGWETWFVPGPPVRHIKSAAAAQAREMTLVASHASLVYYFTKHGMKGHLPFLRLGMLPACAMRSIAAAAAWTLGIKRPDQASRLRAYGKIAAWAAFGRALK